MFPERRRSIYRQIAGKESARGLRNGNRDARRTRVGSVAPLAQERRNIELTVGFDLIASAQSRRSRLAVTALERREVEGTIVRDHPQPRDRFVTEYIRVRGLHGMRRVRQRRRHPRLSWFERPRRRRLYRRGARPCGSFTGADRRHEGCFEAANGGTLLLDELTEMKSQAKLLRVIEEGRVRPVGGAMEVPIDVRVLAASNRDIERAVRDRLLRADLYYRLNVFTLHLLPLRERLEDLPQLIQMFVEQYATRNHKDVIGADEECVQALQANPWPGNVRQLRNVIERALIICEGRTICTKDLPDPSRVADPIATSLYQDAARLIARSRRKGDDPANHRSCGLGCRLDIREGF
jgi:hypothetical protein